MILVILLGLISFLFVLRFCIRLGRIGRQLNNIPGPKGFPIIGNVYHFQVPDEHVLNKLWKTNSKYYPIYKAWSFFYYVVILLDPEDVEVLLRSTENIGKPFVYNFLRPWLSSGLLISTGRKWHTRRKMLTPAFHFNILKHYFTIIEEESQYFMESIKMERNGNPVIKNLRTFISEITLNAICQTALGTRLREKGELESKYRNAVHVYGNITAHRFLKFWYFFDATFAFTSLASLQKETLKTLHSFSRNIIAKRKRFHEETGGKYLQLVDYTDEDKDFKTDIPSKQKLCLLDLLIAASWNGNQIDEEGIQEEVDTFMFEGHDTTASALCCSLSLFAKHKDVQVILSALTIRKNKMREEINTIWQEDHKFIPSSLQKLLYTERCLKESLRLYPSVHVIFRDISNDMQLKHYLIPSNTTCAVNIYNIHRNPKYWPNPKAFDPDRFLPENIKGHHPYSYIPFSAGPRNCIGQKFAMLELKLIVALILHNFELEPVDELDDVTFAPDLTLYSMKPFRVKFIPIR